MFANHRINLDSLIVCKIVLLSKYMIEYGVLTPFPVKARFFKNNAKILYDTKNFTIQPQILGKRALKKGAESCKS